MSMYRFERLVLVRITSFIYESIQQYKSVFGGSFELHFIMEDSTDYGKIDGSLVSNLQTIYLNEVTISKASKKNIQVLKEFLSSFQLTCSDLCPLFKQMFYNFYFTGSAFEGLQVKEAIEFDINVVLHFPFTDDAFWLKEIENPSSFAVFQLKQSIATLIESHRHRGKLINLPLLFDEDNFLIGEKLLSWFQSVVDKYIKFGSFENVNSILKINRTKSGPACTLKMMLVDNAWISIDLVPVFGFNTTNYLQKTVFHDHIIPRMLMSTFCLVPKPVKQADELYDLHLEESSRLWRIHFPNAEKKVLIGRACLKPLIKLVKYLRDKEEWPLASYFIKTVALWIVSKHPESGYFADNELGARFLEMLVSLHKYLSVGHLGHIFYPKFNLLGKMNRQSQVVIRNQLQKIIRKLLENSSCVKVLFNCSKYSKIRKARFSSRSKFRNMPGF